DARKEAYRDAMLSDLRNYAIEQELWRSKNHAYAIDPDTMGFVLNKHVFPVEAAGDANSWMLRLGHEKTDIVCELAGGPGTPLENARIVCWDDSPLPPAPPPPPNPGTGGDDEGEEEPEPPANGKPVASFIWSPQIPNPGELVQFDASGSSDDVGIVSYEWLFVSDGSGATGVTAAKIFATSGAHTVRLIVTDGGGAADTLFETVQVNAPPV